MNINLLPDELKNKTKVNNNIIKANIVMFILIILLFCVSLILKLQNENMQKAIYKIDEQLSDTKYIYSENILKDIKIYDDSIKLYEEQNKNAMNITKDEIMNVLNKVYPYGEVIQIDYNEGYIISVTGVVKKEMDLTKIINEFLKDGYENVNIIERKQIKEELVQFTFEVEIM